MIAALVDNGSLEPAAHRHLRVLAATLSARTQVEVHAVSWQYSHRIPPDALDGTPAWTIGSWLRARWASGDRDYLIVPFFVSPQGEIGSRLRHDIEAIGRELGGCRIAFTGGLGGPAVAGHVATLRIREAIARHRLPRPTVVFVNHGGASAISARVRDSIAAHAAAELGSEIRASIAVSLEGSRHGHNRPWYAEVFDQAGFDSGDVLVAPLFLAPGRHAGPAGDLVRLAAAAAKRHPGLTCHFAAVLGTHPCIVDVLADGIAAAWPQHRPRA